MRKSAPGHAERQAPTSKTPAPKTPPPKTPTAKHADPVEEAAKKLDEECIERFLKINAKYITDGQVGIELVEN